ncbi:MAG: hypothetical protein QM790_13130 [Nibricoccus sp.]
MPLKLPDRFKLSAPARKVVLLPDTYFFCRSVAVAKDASAVDVTTQVEIALEGMAPFPVAQMYYGHFWRPGSQNAFVFAAYRKRFPAEQLETWADAEAVLPSFASVLNMKVAGSTTFLLWTEKTLTAIRWEESNQGPVSVLARELPPELPPEARGVLRDAILRDSGASIQVVECEQPVGLDNALHGEEFVFKCGAHESVFSRDELDLLDVRDKEELANRRRARKRDFILWRVLQGCAALLALCLLLEVGLIGGQIWQKTRAAVVAAQEPGVGKIRLAQSLAQRIEDLSTNRLRPLEMLTIVSDKLPASVIFTSATISGQNTLEIDGQASSADWDVFWRLLNSSPALSQVSQKPLAGGMQNGLVKFRLSVTFRPQALQAAPQS